MLVLHPFRDRLAAWLLSQTAFPPLKDVWTAVRPAHPRVNLGRHAVLDVPRAYTILAVIQVCLVFGFCWRARKEG